MKSWMSSLAWLALISGSFHASGWSEGISTAETISGADDPKEAPGADPEEARRARIKEYYSKWVGVRAPELGQEARDHDKKPVSLSSFRGKRVLLFSFDAGNFNRAPDEKPLLATLRSLDKAVKTVGREKLAVVGFTQGDQFVFPGPKPAGELGQLTDFPVVSAIATAYHKFNEPYNLLLEPSAILIDSQGVLRAFYDHPMTEQELLDTVALGDWDKPVRPVPTEDLYAGKGPPKPTHETKAAWSRPLGQVVGMTGGDWDLRGSNDVIVAAGGEIVVNAAEDGKERHKFASKDVSDFLPNTLGWAKVGKEQSAIFITRGGWPREVPIIGKDGAPLWTLPPFAAGVDSVAWAGLEGNGAKTLIVGLNGGGGLQTFHNGGKNRWSITPGGNIWAVAGIDAMGGRPGLVFYTDGEKVSVLDAQGKDAGTISTEGHHPTKIAASEMNGAGERQVVMVWPAIVGTGDYAVATDLKGKILWKYPVNEDEMNWMANTIIAVDVTGDGTKEWIISPNSRELVVLDMHGRLMARIEATGSGWSAWTAIEHKGKPGWIVTAESGKVSAFTLVPKN